jgi:hypothetical protein
MHFLDVYVLEFCANRVKNKCTERHRKTETERKKTREIQRETEVGERETEAGGRDRESEGILLLLNLILFSLKNKKIFFSFSTYSS